MKSRQENTSIAMKWVRPILIGTVVGAICCLVALLLFAALMAAKDIPQMAVTPLAVLAAAIGSFFGGLTCARVARSRGLVFGAACGAVLYLLIMFAGFAVLKDIRGLYAFVKLLVMVGCSSIGGIIGVNTRKR